MKQIRYMMFAVIALMCSCETEGTDNAFSTEPIAFDVEATGGVVKRTITSSERWIASSDNAWITVSPANGRATTECEFIIDSALTTSPRRGVVRIQNLATWEEREIVISQAGFDYTIEVEEPNVEIANYDRIDDRYFDVTVRSNIDFTVDIPDNAGWLASERHTLDLNRGARPRQTTIRFKWDINTTDRKRLAEVVFRPKSEVELARQDVLAVVQQAAEPIEPDTRAGDSVALLSISRTLQTMVMWDASQSMDLWNNVVLWNESMEGCTPEKVGRVRKAEFYFFNIKESLPFEVRYLTAADELTFFGNTNTFLLNLELGDDISELTQLKRLTLGSYGLISLPKSLARLKNLEYLDICSNNFQTVPDVLTKENFPALRTLILNANQRSAISDLSNSVRTDLGGFMDEPEFPTDLIKWDLDTLVLSVNYLQGHLPTFEDDPEVPYYTQEEIDAVDSLPQILVDRRIKKVMPSTKRFSINLNRLYGKLPDWLLYHPALDLWIPYSLVFPQEGRAKNGTLAVFDNEPANMDYYYKVYTTKKQQKEEDDE
jgi:hypothetical protein